MACGAAAGVAAAFGAPIGQFVSVCVGVWVCLVCVCVFVCVCVCGCGCVCVCMISICIRVWINECAYSLCACE